MTEHYYRYNTDDATIDFENDEVYDYCLEREKLKELDNVGPKCMRDFGGEYKEHFEAGDLKKSLFSNSTINIIAIIIALILLYLIYTSFCPIEQNNIPSGNYIARFKNNFQKN
jgi:hypothetical protein